jgi:hypothetical protein
MPYKGKCFSTCRKRSKTECDHPMCRYNDGRQYKYCRLKHAYKMNAACEPVLREHKGKTGKTSKKVLTQKLHSISKSIKKIELLDDLELSPIHSKKELKQSSAKIEVQELKEAPAQKVTEEEIRDFRERIKKANATRKLKKFMKKHQNKRRAHFLKAICSDADVCMAFGKEASKIKKHFDDFDNFALLSKPAKTIGSVSANGFVKDLTYERDGYVANAILKSSAAVNSDNLLYEGLVGMVLNKLCMYLPVFLETYGIYKYSSPYVHGKMKSEKETDPFMLKATLQKVKTVQKSDIKDACDNSLLMAVLIQHLNEATTIGDQLKNSSTFIDFVSYELLYILYQVYMPLAIMRDWFTHYDLHTGNVLLYEPVKGKYIEYHYHLEPDKDGNKKIISFKSRYIAKIIDYGRCYFYMGDSGFTDNSEDLFKVVCQECTNCGGQQGFGWLDNRYPFMDKHNSYICSSKSNVSHDLRLMYIISKAAKQTAFAWKDTGAQLLSILNKVRYGVNVVLSKEKKEYLIKNPDVAVYAGTEENSNSGLPSKINNIFDAAMDLQKLIEEPMSKAHNDTFYAKYEKLGDLHIYTDEKPMAYIPA